MAKIPPPARLDMSGNVAENWRRFKQQFNFYLVALKETESSDNVKNALLLTIAGPDTIEVYNTFTFVTADKTEDGTENKHSVVMQKLEDYCAPIKNETYERYVFRSTMQKPLQPMDRFITDLKSKVKSCNFGTLEPSCIRD